MIEPDGIKSSNLLDGAGQIEVRVQQGLARGAHRYKMIDLGAQCVWCKYTETVTPKAEFAVLGTRSAVGW